MTQLWIQYAYDNTKTAPVLQTAYSEQEAREDNKLIADAGCWYCWDIDESDKSEGGDGKLTNKQGPFWFDE